MPNTEASLILMTFGGLFLIGLIADLIGRHTPLPRVTLLIITGVLIGPSVFDILPSFTQQWFPVLTDIALAMIGFMLGKSLTQQKLKAMGRPIIGISIAVMIATASLMFTGLVMLGAPLELALILAGIAPATAPAPVVDVTQQMNAKGTFTNTLLGIVAVDDAWGMLLFSFLLVIASVVVGNGDALQSLYTGLWEISGALLLGVIIGFPMAYLTGHIYPGKSSQAEALGLVLLCAGLAEWLEVSYILSAMMMGTIVANYTQHHRQQPFTEIETFEWPLLILFFLLAGASLEINALFEVGLFGMAYIVLRILGRLVGSQLGVHWAGFKGKNHVLYRWIGLAMLPHAGVPIGMALLAIQHFPELKSVILAVILGSTVVFELIGPPFTRVILIRSGETNRLN
ncbi:cation:proton antiporter [Thiomicrorhabdus sp. Kp2]|uniref:cation:proton antiporter n=1 Tax=Thiomicrorhabdus sp. Kp2 TaxID=1123518 RepID=UPI000412ACC0|nr:cation:proton antiporter [Thiomicrorhabdus sp. Kp2]